MTKPIQYRWAVVLGLWSLAFVPGARAGFIVSTLGAAAPGNWAILAVGTGDHVTLNGPGATFGNVGLSTGGQLSLNGSSGMIEVHGNVYFEGSPADFGGSSGCTPGCQVTGSVFTNSALVGQAASDAFKASTTFASLAPTLSVPGDQITGNLTINGVAGTNVLDITSLHLGNGQVLTLNAPAGAQFIINDSGSLTLTSGRILELAGGLGESDVVINVTGTGSNPSTSGGLNNESVIDGILLVPNRGIQFSPGQINGELIADGNISLVSGGNVVGLPPVPEPLHTSWILTGLLGAIAVAGKYRSKRRLS